MGKFKKEDSGFEIKEIIDVLSESDKSDWCKAVAKISWNERPATLDIRRLNMSNLELFPKGISLTDEEADRLTNILLENDYGDLETLKAAVSRKQSRFTISEKNLPRFSSDEPIIVKFNI